jgi:hypothetical protein
MANDEVGFEAMRVRVLISCQVDLPARLKCVLKGHDDRIVVRDQRGAPKLIGLRLRCRRCNARLRRLN